MTRMWTFDLLLRMLIELSVIEWRCQSRLAHSLLHGVLYHLCEQVSKSKWLKFILSVAAAVPVLLLLTYQRCKVLVCLAWYFDADASRYMVYGAAGAGALVVGEQERGCEISLRYLCWQHYNSISTTNLQILTWKWCKACVDNIMTRVGACSLSVRMMRWNGVIGDGFLCCV